MYVERQLAGPDPACQPSVHARIVEERTQVQAFAWKSALRRSARARPDGGLAWFQRSASASELRKRAMRDLVFAAAAVVLTAAVAVTLPARDDRLAQEPGDAPGCASHVLSGEDSASCTP